MTEPTIHVLVVIDGLGPGGAEALLADFAVAAPRLGMRVSVAYLMQREQEPAKERLRAAGVDPVMVPVSALVTLRGLRALRAHVASLGPDLVHTHLGYSDVLAGAAARSLGIPVVSTIHLASWDRGGSPRDMAKLTVFAQARRRLAARVVAVSAAARSSYLTRGWDLPQHVTVVHNGVVARPRPGAGVAVRTEFGLASDDVVVGMLSVLREGKGHDVAISAVRRLRPRFPGLRLLIVGDGPRVGELAALARRHDGVVLAGYRSDVMDVLGAVDVLVHPSADDAFPTALLEAMAASVPVVASRVGGIPEIVVDGVTGLLVDAPPSEADLAGALVPLLVDGEMRSRLGAAAHQRFVDHFTAERWAQRTRRLYDETLVGRSRAAHEPAK